MQIYSILEGLSIMDTKRNRGQFRIIGICLSVGWVDIILRRVFKAGLVEKLIYENCFEEKWLVIQRSGGNIASRRKSIWRNCPRAGADSASLV